MNIAVFCPGWIGDAVMATPALRALRTEFVGCRIVGVVKRYVAGVLEGAPWFDDVILCDASWPKLARRLRRESFDLAVLFRNSFRSAFLAWLGGCQRRIGYDRYCRSWMLTDCLQSARDDHGKLVPSPAIDAYNFLVQELGCPDPGYRMELFTTARDEEAAEQVWRHANLDQYPELVLLNPGAAFGSAKYWPADYFIQLARELVARRKSGVLVLCGPAERELARSIANQAGVCSLADQPLSVGLTKACVRRADLLVTTDSGPRHFAAAFDRPVVTLFGPTHIAWTETYFAKAVHLQKPVPCGPCQKRICPLDHRCMKTLTPAEVYTAATKLLNQNGPLAA